MAKATILIIADRVKDLLNARKWSQSFVAERHYIPRYDPNSLSTLEVAVVPSPDGIVISGSSRNEDREDHSIEISVQAHFDEDTNAVLDPYVLLLEEFADFFRREVLLESGPKTICRDVAYRPVWSPEHHKRFSIYTGVVTLTCECWR